MFCKKENILAEESKVTARQAKIIISLIIFLVTKKSLDLMSFRFVRWYTLLAIWEIII